VPQLEIRVRAPVLNYADAAGTSGRILAESIGYTGASAVAEDERSEEECLHCEINEVVREYVEWHNPVDIADLAARMAESLVELILLAPEAERGKVLAAAITHLGHAFLEKSGAIDGGSDSTH
jgi:hypothetical protein